jgi:poly(3-hydroxybutyrate) depolymerase
MTRVRTTAKLMCLGARGRVLLALAAVVAVALGAATPTSAAQKYPLEGGKGHVDHHVYGKLNGGILYDYLVYRPKGWQKTDRLPLYVALHGCAMNGADMMTATWLNPIADRERFLVAYPDNQGGCWKAVSDDGPLSKAQGTQPSNSGRGNGGEADIVAGMTKQISSRYNVDRSRVYLAGGSSGAFQTAGTAIAYPELYAAIGIVAGAGPGMSVACAGLQDAVVPAYATWAAEQMGKRAHVLPFFVIGGTLDPLGNAGGVGGCSQLAYQELLYMNNLVKPAAAAAVPGACGLLPPDATGTGGASLCTDTYMTNPYATKRGRVPDGYTYTKRSAQDSKTMCEIGQQWIVDGMGHTWPGKAEPKGPTTSELTWSFFKRFRLERGAVACNQTKFSER